MNLSIYLSKKRRKNPVEFTKNLLPLVISNFMYLKIRKQLESMKSRTITLSNIRNNEVLLSFRNNKSIMLLFLLNTNDPFLITWIQIY